jgi:hypothetical protein
MYLAQDPPMLPGAADPARAPSLPRERPTELDLWEEFSDARQQGFIVLRSDGTYHSTIPSRDEFRKLEAFYGFDFSDEFNAAVREQWQYLQEVQIVDAVLLIADALVNWGTASASRRVAGAASGAAEAAMGRLGSVCRRVLAKCGEFIERMAMRIRAVLRRLTGGRTDVPIYISPRSGDTLPGIGRTVAQPDVGRIPTQPDIGRLDTQPAPGRSPAGRINSPRPGDTLPGIGPRGPHTPTQAAPRRSPGGRISGSAGREAEPITLEEAVEVYRAVPDHPCTGPIISATIGCRLEVIEIYSAKWVGYGMPGPPPPYGFRLFQNGVIREFVLHFPDGSAVPCL